MRTLGRMRSFLPDRGEASLCSGTSSTAYPQGTQSGPPSPCGGKAKGASSVGCADSFPVREEAGLRPGTSLGASSHRKTILALLRGERSAPKAFPAHGEGAPVRTLGRMRSFLPDRGEASLCSGTSSTASGPPSPCGGKAKGASSVGCADSFLVRGEAGAVLGDLIHRKRTPFPLRGEGSDAGKRRKP